MQSWTPLQSPFLIHSLCFLTWQRKSCCPRNRGSRRESEGVGGRVLPGLLRCWRTGFSLVDCWPLTTCAPQQSGEGKSEQHASSSLDEVQICLSKISLWSRTEIFIWKKKWSSLIPREDRKNRRYTCQCVFCDCKVMVMKARQFRSIYS